MLRAEGRPILRCLLMALNRVYGATNVFWRLRSGQISLKPLTNSMFCGVIVGTNMTKLDNFRNFSEAPAETFGQYLSFLKAGRRRRRRRAVQPNGTRS